MPENPAPWRGDEWHPFKIVDLVYAKGQCLPWRFFTKSILPIVERPSLTATLKSFTFYRNKRCVAPADQRRLKMQNTFRSDLALSIFLILASLFLYFCTKQTSARNLSS